MPAPSSADIDLASRGAREALSRLADHRFPNDDGDDGPSRIAAVETLWWVRLLSEQLAYPSTRLRGDGSKNDESELVAALRVVRNTVTHKVPIVASQVKRTTVPGRNLLPGDGVYPGAYTELRWVPTDDLPMPDPGFRRGWERSEADYTKNLSDQQCYGSLCRAVGWLTGSDPKFREDGTPVAVPSESQAANEAAQDSSGSDISDR